MEPTEARIGQQNGRSPRGHFGTCLINEATVTPFWAAGRRRVADAGDDSTVIQAEMLAAKVGTLFPFHIDDEVHRLIACGPSRSEEVKTTNGFYSSNSQPNVIRPTPKPRTTLPTTGASPLEMSWQSTGSWPPLCASTPRDSRFPMEGRDLESICKAAVSSIDECLAEAAEVIK